MHCEQNMCPICGSKSNHFLIDEANLDFLSYVARKNKINAAVSITRIIWENTSQLRLAANQKTIVDELSNVILEDFQKKADIILTAIQNLIETFSNVAKELPIGIENDFQNTMALFKRELEALKKSSPTFENVVKAIELVSKNMEETTQKSLSSVRKELSAKFQETLDKMGFPEPEQLKLLVQFVPAVIPLLERLLRLQEVPIKKGKLGELELLRQLARARVDRVPSQMINKVS